MANYLDFEKNIKQLDEDIMNARIRGDDEAVAILNRNLEKEIAKTYKGLDEYQRLALARHPDRPYMLDYVRALFSDTKEIHGDRAFKDDTSIVCFLGYIGGKKVVIIGEQKGRGTKYKIMRNFGMPHPEGYRKALTGDTTGEVKPYKYWRGERQEMLCTKAGQVNMEYRDALSTMAECEAGMDRLEPMRARFCQQDEATVQRKIRELLGINGKEKAWKATWVGVPPSAVPS